MIATRRTLRRTVALTVLACLVAVPALATGPGAPHRGGSRGMGFAQQPQLGPAGPTPLDPAGPTPLNPAGPTPLNPTGPARGLPRRGARIQQPGVFVGVVGGGNVGVPLQGSFYCQVHNRGYATQSLFFDHLAGADGVRGDEAMSFLVEDGGVWVFPVE
jgi:hypothetical protein